MKRQLHEPLGTYLTPLCPPCFTGMDILEGLTPSLRSLSTVYSSPTQVIYVRSVGRTKGELSYLPMTVVRVHLEVFVILYPSCLSGTPVTLSDTTP